MHEHHRHDIFRRTAKTRLSGQRSYRSGKQGKNTETAIEDLHFSGEVECKDRTDNLLCPVCTPGLKLNRVCGQSNSGMITTSFMTENLAMRKLNFIIVFSNFAGALKLLQAGCRFGGLAHSHGLARCRQQSESIVK
jgi:hypothetical protein